NFFSPCWEKISEIDIPNFAATISSVSCNARPVLRFRQRPTDDFPAPIIPMRAIDRLRSVTVQYLINTGLQPHLVPVLLRARKGEFAGKNESNALQCAHA